MGESQLDFHIARTHSVEFDEVWAINAMAGIIPNPDRVFAMDPMTRYFDTEDAGGQTKLMRKTLSTINCPVYSVELDKRAPSVELYPIEAIIQDTECGYLNNKKSSRILYDHIIFEKLHLVSHPLQ